MRCRVFPGLLAAALTLGVGAGRASAQAMLADDIVILSKGQREQEKSRTGTHLGPSPGAGCGGPTSVDSVSECGSCSAGTSTSSWAGDCSRPSTTDMTTGGQPIERRTPLGDSRTQI